MNSAKRMTTKTMTRVMVMAMVLVMVMIMGLGLVKARLKDIKTQKASKGTPGAHLPPTHFPSKTVLPLASQRTFRPLCQFLYKQPSEMAFATSGL